MAKSLPKVRPGIMARGQNLLEANLLMFFVDQALKNDDEPILIKELADMVHESKATVTESLQRMTERGILTLPSGQDWGLVGAFTIGKITLNLRQASVDDEEDEGQEEMDFSDPDRTPIPAPNLTREQRRKASKRDDVEIEGTNYIGVVSGIERPEGGDGVVGYQLDIWVKDVGSTEDAVHRVRQQRGYSDIENGFSSETEAWRWFDEWLVGQSPEHAADALAEPTADQETKFLDGLIASEHFDGDVHLAKDAYDFLLGIAQRDIEATEKLGQPQEFELEERPEGVVIFYAERCCMHVAGGHTFAQVMSGESKPQPFDWITYCKMLPEGEGRETLLCPELFGHLLSEVYTGIEATDPELMKATEERRLTHLGRVFVSHNDGHPMPSEETEADEENPFKDDDETADTSAEVNGDQTAQDPQDTDKPEGESSDGG